MASAGEKKLQDDRSAGRVLQELVETVFGAIWPSRVEELVETITGHLWRHEFRVDG